MALKTIQSTALSVLLHCVLIFGLVSFTIPDQKHQIKKKPIKSYLVFENSATVSEPVNNSSDILGEVIDQGAQKIETSAQPKIQKVIKLKVESVAKYSLDGEKPPKPDAVATVSLKKIQTRVSEYIQNLHSKELGRLSDSALNEFRKPQPLIDKTTPLSTNQRLKALSSSFAPMGSDMIVLSEFGSNETTIIQGDTCLTITQTALDDKVWKGASLWAKNDSCGKYDKFDGQLQRSLDKYLQK